MGSKSWTWVLNLLKSFGSQTWGLGLDSNKVMKASRFELGLWFKNKGHVNFKPWVWTSTHSGKIRWALNLGLKLNLSKVTWISTIALGPWFVQGQTLVQGKSCEPQALSLGFNSSKVMLVLSLEFGPLIQSMSCWVRYPFLKKWAHALDLDFHFMLFWIPKPFFKHGPKSGIWTLSFQNDQVGLKYRT